MAKLIQHRWPEAVEDCAGSLEALQAEYSLIVARVLQELVFQELSEAARALSALKHALSLAEPESYVRTFVDEGEPMVHLLHYALAEGIVPSYVSRLLTALGGNAPPTSPVRQALGEPLTERELEVLRLVAAGLSNRQIARGLVVAMSTVKTHINHIYGKLDVHSRTQAVTRGRELALL